MLLRLKNVLVKSICKVVVTLHLTAVNKYIFRVLKSKLNN